MKGITVAVVTHLIVKYVFTETPVGDATAKYDPAELLRKIFNTNDTILPRANYGLIQFEGQIPQQDFVNFQAQSDPENNRETSYIHESSVKFENDYEISNNINNQNVVKFVDGNKEASKKKKRRKRKPKQHYGLQSPGNVPNLPYPGYGYAPSLPYPGHYGNQQNLPYPGYANGPGNPLKGGHYYRPPRQRPRPSVASEALSAVTAALTSIAMYDDYQCVPRLLCEAAAGGALGSAGILQTVSGLQPLLTLLSAYSGLTSNPLFVFGRAALLGASDGNAATCRYAYPLCPTDPEQLVYYLNNHNGGFFRFFNAPQQGQQNVEQYYNQLSHNFRPYDPDQEYNQNINQQNYGLYNNQHSNGYSGLYSNYNQNYGLAYPYQNNNQNIRFKNNDDFRENTNEIQKRIQNKPNTLYIDDLDDGFSRWTFPEANGNIKVNYVNNDAFNSFNSYSNFNNDEGINHYDRNRYQNDKRKGKILKFPGSNNENDLQANFENIRGFFFPDQDNQPYFNYNGPLGNNYDNKYYDKREYSDYNNPSNNYDSKYQDEKQYFNYNTATNHNNYDIYNDKRQYSEFNYPSNSHNYDGKYHDKRQYLDYNTDIIRNNYDKKYNDNRYLDYNIHSNKNFENKYANNDGNYYANKYYANKNTDDYVNKNKYNYNNDIQNGVRTVYVVRGNGDPNNPEVHKLRPGESIP